jgi:hypothetical protein
MTNVGPIRSSAKEKLTKYIRRTCSRWQIALIPIVSSNETTLCNRVVSVPAEEHNIHITYITTYPPSGAPRV